MRYFSAFRGETQIETEPIMSRGGIDEILYLTITQ